MKQHTIYTMFVDWLKKWETNPKNKQKLNPPRIIQAVVCNDRAINNFLEIHTEIVDLPYANTLNRYEIKTEFIGRRTYRVWGELLKG